MTAPAQSTLILASSSPRRRELLSLIGLPFEVRVSGIDETPRDGETPVEYVRRVAREKAVATAPPAPLLRDNTAGEGGKSVVIAADTEVVIDGEILGKPRTADEATAMLAKLRGRTHEVISAVAVLDSQTGQLREDVCRSGVPMRDYSDEEIAVYVASGDPMDKAGAYAIQHDGFHPVENFSHCYASVMGLPLCHLTRTLRQFGIEPAADVPSVCQQFNGYQCPVYRDVLNGHKHE
jgi:MAF protein